MKARLALRTGTDNQQATLNEWDCLPKETAVAYEAFMVYCDQEANRSLSYVAGLLNRTLATVERWSLRWNWVQRCHAFDLAQEERNHEDDRRARRSMRRRQAEAGRLLQDVANLGISELQQKVDQNLPIKLTPPEIVGFIRIGAALERRARGEEVPDRPFTKIEVIFAHGDQPYLSPASKSSRPAIAGENETDKFHQSRSGDPQLNDIERIPNGRR